MRSIDAYEDVEVRSGNCLLTDFGALDVGLKSVARSGSSIKELAQARPDLCKKILGHGPSTLPRFHAHGIDESNNPQAISSKSQALLSNLALYLPST